MPVQRLTEARANDMGDDEGRDAQTEHELERLDRFPSKLSALIQRPDAETGMNKAGRIEQDRDRQELPEHRVDVDAGGKGIHRDIAERMIDEMADQIGEQHHAADEADLAQADAAGECAQFYPGLRRPSIHMICIGDYRV